MIYITALLITLIVASATLSSVYVFVTYKYPKPTKEELLEAVEQNDYDVEKIVVGKQKPDSR